MREFEQLVHGGQGLHCFRSAVVAAGAGLQPETELGLHHRPEDYHRQLSHASV